MTTDETGDADRLELIPIMGPNDFFSTIEKVRAILSANPTSADVEYVDTLQRLLDRYEMSCGHPRNQEHPSTSAIRRLRYLLEEVKQTTPAQSAVETGIDDLPQILRGFRKLTAEENAILVEYFGCPPDSFRGLVADE